MDKRIFEDKQYSASENVKNAIGWLVGIMDTLEDVSTNITLANDVSELLDALNSGELEQAIRDIESALDYLQDAYNEVDDELIEAVEEEQEA